MKFRFDLKDKELVYYENIMAGFDKFERYEFPLLGIEQQDRRHVLSCQLVESLRRGRYIKAISERKACGMRRDPDSTLFDPERAAVFFRDEGNIEEAFWLVFLATHFGKHRINGWKTLRFFYYGNGPEHNWTWRNTCNNVVQLKEWLIANHSRINYGFGNHRKYESLDVAKENSTFFVIQSYIDWIIGYGNHQAMLDSTRDVGLSSPEELFHFFYSSLSCVKRFGRLGKFDYLSLLGNLKLVDVKAGSMYLSNATGPLKGARLLFENSTLSTIKVSDVDEKSILLDQYIKVGMQPLEDALCNWQKSPSEFIAFRG
ncbi:hypothetical protein [Chromobacterium sp. IIBBL 290-4]|uniref:alpha-glutamyl/putrescinyl thymine pyrophosphorylase clade 3 protein n=1 Tax=Chromobacterium sp. IIBBL 290-4 TaxID=2953890 RepID=UPI0020B845F5|nr:hypothetical protein [Chromobacterium sp. IIBBL 290-4]UTH75679.1 hypothetical protein NKT35_06160 [Chromobacterium sp. IIBBL 290-4]